MGDGKIIDRIFADALSQMESDGASAPSGAPAPAPAGGPGEEKEQNMENDTGAPAEDMPPAGDDAEDLDALLENLTQNGEVPPAGDAADRDLDDVLDEMFPDGAGAEGAAAPAPNPADASPLDDLMASAMDIEDMPALDEMPEDAPAAGAGDEPAPAGANPGEGLDGDALADDDEAADLAGLDDLATAGSHATEEAPADDAGDDLVAGLEAGALGGAAAESLPAAGLSASGPDAAAKKKKPRSHKKTEASAAEEEEEAGTAAEEPLPDDLADLAAAAAEAEKEEDALRAGDASADDALAAMAAAPEELAPEAEEASEAGDAALHSMGLDGPAPVAGPPLAAADAPEDADKERLLAHLAARFDVLARRKLSNLPASQVRLIRSVNLRVDIELKFGEFSASGDDDSLFRLDE